MKSISDPAMAAIQAGEAIVTGAVEFYTPGRGPVGIPEASDVVLSWQQMGDAFAFPSTGNMAIEYFDEAGDQIGLTETADSINAAPNAWTLRQLNSSTPAGAVRMRIHVGITRVSGVFADQGFDDITLTVGGTSVPLTNPGAELGNSTGWTPDFGAPIEAVTSMASSTAGPYAGDYFFRGGENAVINDYQDIYLSEIAPPEPVPVEAFLRVWGGYGPIEIDGSEYQGVGDRGLAQQTSGAIGGIAQGIELILSRVEPELLTLLDADEIKGGAVVLRRLIFASDGKTLLDYDIWDRGRVDAVETIERIGSEATIKVSVESAARGLGRSGQRMRADSDQRLINPNDGYFRKCSYAGEKMLYWGGRKPERQGLATYVGNPASGGVN